MILCILIKSLWDSQTSPGVMRINVSDLTLINLVSHTVIKGNYYFSLFGLSLGVRGEGYQTLPKDILAFSCMRCSYTECTARNSQNS